MKVSFLSSPHGIPATKTFSRDEQGEIRTTGYPHIRDFTSHTHEFGTIEELKTLIDEHAAQYHCLLKGQLLHPLVSESRAGSTDNETLTQFEVMDIDGLKGTPDVDTFIRNCLPPEYHDVDHIIQYSCSYGVMPQKGLSAHVFFLHARPVMPTLLKQHVTHLNLTNTFLKDELKLNSTGTGLKYPLDRTVAQNDKLIYIAPPICQDGVVDNRQGDRIRLVKRNKRYVDITFQRVNAALNQQIEGEIVNALREKIGLKKKTAKFKFIGDTQICINPDRGEVTAPPKRERGFVYLSLNGGRSYPYWYPENNPTILYNWKGEPPVLLKDFLPNYWENVAQNRKNQSTDQKYLAFRDFASDTYWNGHYDAGKQEITVARAGSREKLFDFLKQHEQPLPDAIPDWNYRFEPRDKTLIDFDKRFLNKFKLSPYLQNPVKGITRVPPTIQKILWSVVGSDQAAYDYFINWLACLVQYREKLGTAWVLHGTEGTGKGLLYHNILKPIIGAPYCAIKQLADFEDQFNDWIENCILLLVDEAKITSSKSADKTVNQLKNMITEPTGKIRRMHAGQQEVQLYTNIIFASNDYDAMRISATDRRFNIGVRQEVQIEITADDIGRISTELNDFAGYLVEYKADREQARRPLVNQAKLDMRAASQTSTEQFFGAVRNGNLEYFAQYLNDQPNLQFAHLHGDFERAVRRWISQANIPDSKVTRDELFSVYSYLQGARDMTINKFSRMMGHHNLKTKNMRIGEKQVYGIETTWNAKTEQLAAWTDNNVVQFKKAG